MTFATGLPVFNAFDPENAAETAITWSISGDDAKRFEIRKGTISLLTTSPPPPAGSRQRCSAAVVL